METIVAAVKAVKRFITAEAWQGFVTDAWEPLASANTDEELTRYARDHASRYVKLDPWTVSPSDLLTSLAESVCSTLLELQRYLNVETRGGFWTLT